MLQSPSSIVKNDALTRHRNKVKILQQKNADEQFLSYLNAGIYGNSPSE